MADNTIIQQGAFVSAGVPVQIPIRSGVDWMEVWNLTEAAAANANHGVQYYWQLGMPVNDGIVYVRNGAATAIDLTTSVTLTVPGFLLIDSSLQNPSALFALTSISGATPPRVLVASTAGLNTGNVVRIINTAGAVQLGGIEFTITVIDPTNFDLQFMAPIVAAAGPGSYRVIPFDPIFYPRRRFISAISKASLAVVKMTVSHGYTVGQLVRFIVPAAFGMVQMDGLIGSIVAVDLVNNTITVNIDSTGFSTFAFPLTAAHTFSPALVVPVGETADATISDPNLLDDATINTAFIGMQLGAGITSPAGSINDIIFWKAGKSFNV